MLGESVTVLRAASVTDPYSGEATDLDWSDPAEHEVPGCAFDPGTGSEPATTWRQGMSVTPTLYAPHGADITAADRVRVRAQVYEVDGEPSSWVSPTTGAGHGLVVPLSKFGS